jgi:aerobic-type carbon monoxide dehydrogenase small subunit (CoxS/CutS family)
VLVDGELISSCILLAPLAEGSAVTTAEGLPADHPIRAGFADAHAFQCGFCTPAMALTAARLLEEHPDPTSVEIRLALAANLCRCGCYVKIEDAVLRAAGKPTEGS